MTDETKTVRVRIAVAVDPETLEWNSCGWGREDNTRPPDNDMMGLAVDPLRDGVQRFWLEAEIAVKKTRRRLRRRSRND